MCVWLCSIPPGCLRSWRCVWVTLAWRGTCTAQTTTEHQRERSCRWNGCLQRRCTMPSATRRQMWCVCVCVSMCTMSVYVAWFSSPKSRLEVNLSIFSILTMTVDEFHGGETLFATLFPSVGVRSDMLGGVFSWEDPLPWDTKLRHPQVHWKRREAHPTHPLSKTSVS